MGLAGKRVIKKMEADSSGSVHRERTKSNSRKLESGKFCLDIKKKKSLGGSLSSGWGCPERLLNLPPSLEVLKIQLNDAMNNLM